MLRWLFVEVLVMRLVSSARPFGSRPGKVLAALVGFVALALLMCCGSAIFFAMKSRQEQEASLAEADKLYASKPAEAVAKYKDGYPAAGARKPEVLQRIVDHEAKAGNAVEARRWVEKGLDEKVNATYEVPAARDILAQVQRERAEAEAKKKAEHEAKEQAKRDAQEKKDKEKKEKERYGSYTEAMSNAEKAIRKNLPFPNDATFRALGQPVIQNPDGSWQVSGTVATRDASGVRVTYLFRGAMLRSADGSWQSVGDIFLDPQ